MVLLVLAGLLAIGNAQAQGAGLAVTDLSDSSLQPLDLVEALAGSGIQVVAGSVQFTGDDRAAGVFSGGTGIIGFEDGIILGTGRVVDVVGPNAADGTSTAFGTPGYPDLDNLTLGTTFDAAVLEFDFDVPPNVAAIRFEYVFGSEEYNEYVGSEFNDGFAFWVNGENCALTPDGEPVTINTINNGQPGVAATNPHLYINNDPRDPDQDGTVPEEELLDTEMDGFTLVLECVADVSPGTNSIRLAIADTADATLDSWVFIRQESLTIIDTPSAPLDLVATAGLGEITLDWQEPASDGGSPINSYRVYHLDGGDAVLIGNVSATSFVDMDLGPGVTRDYHVAAINAVGEGPASETASATTFDVPGAPLGLVATAGLGEITLDWQEPASDGGAAVTHYAVYRGDAPETLSFLATVNPATSYVDAGLADGLTQYYHVTANNTVGGGAPSGTVSATTFDLPEAPLETAVVAVLVAPGAPGLEVSWQSPASDGGCGLQEFSIYSGAESGTLTFLATENAGSLVHTDDTVEPGATRHYAVRAVNCVGDGPLGDEVSATAFDVPGAPLDLAAATGPGAGNVSLDWLAPEGDGGLDVTGYRLYRGVDAGDLSLLAELGLVFEYLDTELASGETFWYAVGALNDVGEGPLSAVVDAATLDFPSAPQSLVGSAGPGVGEITITWDAPAETDGLPVTEYRVYNGATSGDLHFLAAVDAEPQGLGVQGEPAFSFVESGLANSTTRYYAVAAVTAAGEGPLSNEAHGTSFAPQSAPPPLPEGRAYTSAIWQGNFAYIFGGLSDDDADQDTIVRFDPATNEVIIMDFTLPSPRHGTSAVWVPDVPGVAGDVGSTGCHGSCLAGTGFVFGGDQRLLLAGAEGCHGSCLIGQEILMFEPVGGSVSPMQSTFPDARAATSAVWDEETGLAYIFGGLGLGDPDSASDAGAQGCHGSCLVGLEIWAFDPVQDSLSLHDATLPASLWGTSAVWDSIAGVGYVFGGFHDEEEPSAQGCHGSCMSRIWLFDPQESSVQPLPVQLPSDRWNTSASFDGRYAYVFGGETHDGPLDEVVRFDTLLLTVEVVGALPAERSGTSAVWTGTDAFVFGGDDGQAPIDDIVRFTPSAPRDVNAQRTSTAGQVWVDWKVPLEEGPGGVTGYRLYRAAEGGELLPVADLQGKFHLDTGLDIGVTYRYRVSALNEFGEGPQSPEVSVATAAEPGAPRFLIASPGPAIGEVKLQWYHPEDTGGLPVDEYRIYRGTDPENLTLLTTVSGATIEYIDTVFGVANPDPFGLVTDFYYRVAAVNALGEGEPSELACASPAPWVGLLPGCPAGKE